MNLSVTKLGVSGLPRSRGDGLPSVWLSRTPLVSGRSEVERVHQKMPWRIRFATAMTILGGLLLGSGQLIWESSAWAREPKLSRSEEDWTHEVFPVRTHDFGTVARGSKVRCVFPVVNKTADDLEIAEVRTKCGCTEVRVGARVVPPGTKTTIEAILDTTKFVGYKASGLTLVLKRPTFAEIDLNFTAFIRSEITLEPGQADFGVVPRGSGATLKMRLAYNGKRADWQVTRMRTQRAGIKATLDPRPRTKVSDPIEYDLTIALNPAVPAGPYKDEITISTNDPDTPEFLISVSAVVQSSLTVSPSVLNLGRTPAGSTLKRAVVIKGRAPFRVTGFSGDEGMVKLVSDSAADAARPLHTLTLELTLPDRPGPFHLPLTIVTDQTGDATARLSIFATIEPR